MFGSLRNLNHIHVKCFPCFHSAASDTLEKIKKEKKQPVIMIRMIGYKMEYTNIPTCFKCHTVLNKPFSKFDIDKMVCPNCAVCRVSGEIVYHVGKKKMIKDIVEIPFATVKKGNLNSQGSFWLAHLLAFCDSVEIEKENK